MNKHLKICVQKVNQKKVNYTIGTIDNTDDTNDKNDIIIDTDTNHNLNRTLIVGPSFCGKTHLFPNKLPLVRMDSPEQKIRIFTRSPEQYRNTEREDLSVEEDLEDRSTQDFQN